MTEAKANRASYSLILITPLLKGGKISLEKVSGRLSDEKFGIVHSSLHVSLLISTRSLININQVTFELNKLL